MEKINALPEKSVKNYIDEDIYVNIMLEIR